MHIYMISDLEKYYQVRERASCLGTQNIMHLSNIEMKRDAWINQLENSVSLIQTRNL